MPTDETVRPSRVTLSESSMHESASPTTTLDPSPGTPAAPASVVAHIVESFHEPTPPFQV